MKQFAVLRQDHEPQADCRVPRRTTLVVWETNSRRMAWIWFNVTPTPKHGEVQLIERWHSFDRRGQRTTASIIGRKGQYPVKKPIFGDSKIVTCDVPDLPEPDDKGYEVVFDRPALSTDDEVGLTDMKPEEADKHISFRKIEDDE